LGNLGLEPGEDYEYILDVTIDVDADAVSPLRLEAGCFVLICNLSIGQERSQWIGESLLELYKNQSGIEQNVGFLKDPVIVNSIFLKKPTRIEVLVIGASHISSHLALDGAQHALLSE
jgi:transposase